MVVSKVNPSASVKANIASFKVNNLPKFTFKFNNWAVVVSKVNPSASVKVNIASFKVNNLPKFPLKVNIG